MQILLPRRRYLVAAAALLALAFEIYVNVPRDIGSHLGVHSISITRMTDTTPKWMRVSTPCAPPNDAENHEDDLALQVFKTFPNGSGMNYAAFKNFGTGHVRREGNRNVFVCANEDIQAEFAALSVKGSYWRAGSFPGNHDVVHLEVARRIGPRFPQIVAIVAETAFAPRAIANNLWPSEDIRSLARVILAEFGADIAAPWSDQGFDAIEDSQMGAAAAQIAIVTRHPGALAKTSALLAGILRRYPTDPMPNDAWVRFYDLAFALAAAGPDAKPFIDPVVRMTCRTIDSWAPPFGWIAISPSDMLRVLQIVGVDPCHAAR